LIGRCDSSEEGEGGRGRGRGRLREGEEGRVRKNQVYTNS